MHALRRAGFETSDLSALGHLESKLEEFLSVLPLFAAQQARLRSPQVHDLVSALLGLGPSYDAHSLRRLLGRASLPSTSYTQQDATQLPAWAAPERDFIQVQSAQEEREAMDDMTLTRKRKRGEEIPQHLPPFPAPHTWSETAAYPMSNSTSLAPLALVERKLASARLVQAALSRLIQQTEAVAVPSSSTTTTGAATPQSTGAATTGSASEATPTGGKSKKLALRLRTSVSSAANPALAQLAPPTPAGSVKEALSARSGGASFMPPPPPLASAGLLLGSSASAGTSTLPMSSGTTSAATSALVMRRRTSVLLAGEEDPWSASVPRGWPGMHGTGAGVGEPSTSSSSASGFSTPGAGTLHTPGGAQHASSFPTSLGSGGASAALLHTPALATSGAATPLAGTPFAYPPTPSDAYASWAPVTSFASSNSSSLAATVEAGIGGDVPLPKAVHYRGAPNGTRRIWKV